MIITPAYIQRAESVMTYTDDVRLASSNITHHHGLRSREQKAGDGWRETEQAHSPSGV